jgi:hypothetical protein
MQREKERENPIQLNTRIHLDPVHSSCNQCPAMGTPAPLSPPSNNHYRAIRQQSRDEPAAFPIEPSLCASAHDSLRNAHWSCQQSSVPTTRTTTPCPPRRTESQDTFFILRSGIASPLHLRSVALDTQTCASNGDSGM